MCELHNSGKVVDSRSSLPCKLVSPHASASLAWCAGCATCKHPSGRKTKIKAHTARKPCASCPFREHCTSADQADLGSQEASSAGCTARPEAACECEFHARMLDRHVDKVSRLKRALKLVKHCRAWLGRRMLAVWLSRCQGVQHATGCRCTSEAWVWGR